ncbi:Hypothetical predicted protein [Cloeon dipterum]|uniref:Gustatory receptor n=1 Tax=Cloeon dipterum TaxID=197152 RepID=A0A8S1D2K4_9INSE|nr:Hypothetical predicted protein [Cloeon dipterum]
MIAAFAWLSEILLRNINKSLQEKITQKQLLSLRDSYRKICGLIDSTSVAFQPLTAISVPYTFLNFLWITYYVVILMLKGDHYYDNREIDVVLNCLSWLFSLALNLLYLLERCNRVNYQLCQIKKILYKLELTVTDEGLKQDITLFYLETLHYQRGGYNIFKVFELGTSTVTIMFGPHFFAYLATIIQFHYAVTITVLRWCYVETCSLVELTSQAFQPLNICMVPSFFIFYLINVFYLTLAFWEDDNLSAKKSFSIAVDCSCWIIVLTLNLIYVTMRCHRVEEKIKSTKNILYYLEMRSTDEIKESVSLFFHESMHYQSTSFNVLNSQMINRSLLATVAKTKNLLYKLEMMNQSETSKQDIATFYCETIHCQCVGFYTFIAIIQTDLLISVLARISYYTLRKINIELGNMKEAFSNRPDIELLRMSFNKICMSIDVTSCTFQPLTLFSVPITIFLNIANGYFLLVTIAKLEEKFGNYTNLIVNTTLWLSLTFMNILNVTNDCQKAQREVAATRDILYKLEMRLSECELREKVRAFYFEVVHYQNTSYNIYGVYKLDFSLMAIVYGTIVTYLATFIQFHMLIEGLKENNY